MEMTEEKGEETDGNDGRKEEGSGWKWEHDE